MRISYVLIVYSGQSSHLSFYYPFLFPNYYVDEAVAESWDMINLI